MENLYLWYLNYNPYLRGGIWCAVERSKSSEYLNGTLSSEEVLKNKDVNILIKYICQLK